MVIVETKHFSLIAVLGAAAVGGFVYYESESILPNLMHPDGPFITYKPNIKGRGYYLSWSTKLKGLDKNGFKDTALYRSEVIKLCQQYGIEAPLQAVFFDSEKYKTFSREMDRLFNAHLIPDQVKTVDEALTHAKTYLDDRKFKKPWFDIAVYLVPSNSDTYGSLKEPWLTRRYLVISDIADITELNSTVLHEFFHHYQSAHAWIDRNEFIPFVEASAVFIEREALPYYLEHFKIQLNYQYTLYNYFKNGVFNQESMISNLGGMQDVGYAMSWFMEYLRDNWYQGNKDQFHVDLLNQWGKTYRSNSYYAYLWAVGGNEKDLRLAWTDFVDRYVIEGSWTATRYELVYKAIYGDSFYLIDHNHMYTDLAFEKATHYEIGNAQIKPWSLQAYQVTPPLRGESKLIIKVPDNWDDDNPGRNVYIKDNENVVDPDNYYQRLENGAPSIEIDFRNPQYIYFIDTGQSDSLTLTNYQEAEIYLLEPPKNVSLEIVDQKLRVTWDVPPSVIENPYLYNVFEVYMDGQLVQTVQVDNKQKYEVWLNGNPDKTAYEVAVLLKDHDKHQSYEASAYTEKEVVEIPKVDRLDGYWKGYIRLDGGADREEFIEYIGEELSLLQIWFENDPTIELEPDQYVVWMSIFGLFDQYGMEFETDGDNVNITGDIYMEDGSGEIMVTFYGSINNDEMEGNYDISGQQVMDGESYGVNIEGYFYLKKQ